MKRVLPLLAVAGLLLILPGAARAIDHDNIDGGRPLRFEDADADATPFVRAWLTVQVQQVHPDCGSRPPCIAQGGGACCFREAWPYCAPVPALGERSGWTPGAQSPITEFGRVLTFPFLCPFPALSPCHRPQSSPFSPSNSPWNHCDWPTYLRLALRLFLPFPLSDVFEPSA